MYRSTEEMTARLKSLNFKLKLSYTHDSQPVVVKHKNRIVRDEIEFTVKDTDHKEEIEFDGFTSKDPRQKISCNLEYDKEKVHMESISSFLMENNKYVKNIKIENCKDIFFNGRMFLHFNKAWLKNNILAGANLDENYCKWENVNLTNETFFCVGDSLTFGEGVATSDTWPSLLNRGAYNFGSRGLSHDGCLKNVKYILNNSDYVKQIVCLLPEASRKLLEFEFLGHTGCIPVSLNTSWKLPKEYQKAVKETVSFIMDEKAIINDWIRCCSEIIALCKERNVECWLSTWAERLHKHIPKQNRLPIFPEKQTFTERATDEMHPHRKHYELFVKKIKPYIDKKQI